MINSRVFEEKGQKKRSQATGEVTGKIRMYSLRLRTADDRNDCGI